LTTDLQLKIIFGLIKCLNNHKLLAGKDGAEAGHSLFQQLPEETEEDAQQGTQDCKRLPPELWK
jgi:hypothetical protein